MEKTKSFQDLLVWQKAHKLVKDQFSKQWNLAEEVSKMLNSYRRAILNSKF